MGRLTLLTAAIAAAAVAGCGGDEGMTTSEQPRLPNELAAALAVESEAVARSLDAGEDCAALRQAQALQARIGDAVSGGEADPVLGAEMSEAAQSLADGIVCEPTPTLPAETATAPADPCEAIQAEIERLKEQAEQSKEEGGGSSSKELEKQLKEQAKALEEQFKQQCEGQGDGDGGDGDGGPGNSGGGGPPPGRGNGGGEGDGGD